jgi:DNA-binding IscR family transcriptional regulator
MRTLADQNGGWTSANQVARRTHRQPSELAEALKDLTSDGIVEVLAAPAPEDVSYRLPADEPTSVVLHRLIEMATHSQDLRAIIAAHMQHVRQQAQIVRTSTVAA